MEVREGGGRRESAGGREIVIYRALYFFVGFDHELALLLYGRLVRLFDEGILVLRFRLELRYYDRFEFGRAVGRTFCTLFLLGRFL